MEVTSVLHAPVCCPLIGKMTATGLVAVQKPKQELKEKDANVSLS